MSSLLHPLGATSPLGRNVSGAMAGLTAPFRSTRKLGFKHAVSTTVVGGNARRHTLRAAAMQRPAVCSASQPVEVRRCRALGSLIKSSIARSAR